MEHRGQLVEVPRVLTVKKKTASDVTIRISKNRRNSTTTILAYRKGGFKRAYKAVIPMCNKNLCRQTSLHSMSNLFGIRVISYHQCNINTLVKNLIKSYS